MNSVLPIADLKENTMEFGNYTVWLISVILQPKLLIRWRVLLCASCASSIVIHALSCYVMLRSWRMETARAAVRDAVYCLQQGVIYFQNVTQFYRTVLHRTVFTYARKERPCPGRFYQNSATLNRIMHGRICYTDFRPNRTMRASVWGGVLTGPLLRNFKLLLNSCGHFLWRTFHCSRRKNSSNTDKTSCILSSEVRDFALLIFSELRHS
jgi:hypothetical protein